jgi:hypothetical protein
VIVVVEFKEDEEGLTLIEAVTGGDVAKLDAVLQFGTGTVRGKYATYAELAKAATYLAQEE